MATYLHKLHKMHITIILLYFIIVWYVNKLRIVTNNIHNVTRYITYVQTFNITEKHKLRAINYINIQYN